MDVILLENMPRLGKIGDIVAVRNGFGRNFLIPQQKAVRATDENRKEFEVRRETLEKRDRDQRDAARRRAEALGGLVVRIVRQASEDGRLYGSVSVRDVAAALGEAGHVIERRQIDLNSGIKNLGAYEATVMLHADVRVPVKVEVVRSLEASLLAAEIEEAQPEPTSHAADESEE